MEQPDKEMLVGEEELAGADTGTSASVNESEQLYKQTVPLASCRVQGVTVYNDRAEVTRLIALTDLEAGTTEVRVVGLSSKVDRNSVRVSGGKGEAVILEVSYNTKWEPKTKDDGSERSTLQRELDQLAEQIARQEEGLARIAAESAWMSKWASGLAEPRKTEAGSSASVDLCPPQALDQATAFLSFYQSSLAGVDERRAAVNATLRELREQHARVSRTLGSLTTGNVEEVHEVTVLLSSEGLGEVELSLAYVVMDASWHAAYDVRVTSNDSRLNLTYYGIITNNSLDHWQDAPLALSTAQPSVGGAPPDLPTRFVGFQQPQYHSRAMLRGGSPWMNSMVKQAEVERFDLQSIALDDHDFSSSAESQVGVMTSSVKESSICTSFEIPRRSTIMSDSKPHKVTIKIIQLKAKFTYVLLPKLSTHAYLKASIVNDSDKYAFLAGDMNVFVDGNFVAKSSIHAVSPSESFAIFLGADDAIKVTYPPGVFFNDQQGLLRRSNLKTVKHTITIKNTKATDVHVSVFDQLPKSNDGQIKVRLLKPAITEADKSVTLTASNNVKWKVDIKAGKQVQLPFEYQLEWPLGQEINL